MSEVDKQLQKARNEVEDYKQTVKALLAFSAFVVHDGQGQRPEANFGFGRRMTTSKENKIKPEHAVTPDLVAQKSMTYGIAAEIKKSLPKDEARWGKHLEQLLKYDDVLEGWWTDDKQMPCADVVMLIHQSRGRPFSRFLQRSQGDDPECVGPSTSIVEFNSSEETQSFYFFRLEHGTIRDDELSKTLDEGIQVPLDKVLESFPNVLFYDSQPPAPLLLTHLWMDVFPAMIGDAGYDEKYKAIKFPASVREVTEELQTAYGSATLSKDDRSVEFPSQRWVKGAFEKLVEFKLALPPSDGNDTYQILFRTPRSDILKRFIELDSGKETADEVIEDQGEQMDLFTGDEDEE